METTRLTSVHLLTFATHEKGTLSVLIERAKSAGFKVHVIGMGTQWKGFGWRLKSYHQYILKLLSTKSSGAPSQSKKEGFAPNDLVILVDGYDVIPLGTPSDVLDGFQRYNTDVLVSAESNCTPYMLPSGVDPFKAYLPHCNDTPFINAGGIAGKAHAMASFLGDLIQSQKIQDNDDDQAAITQFYLHHLQNHKKRREGASLLPLREADHPIVCLVESSSFGDPIWKRSTTSDMDLEIAISEITKKSITAIKMCLDLHSHVFQNSEFNEGFLQPCPQMGQNGRYYNRRTKTFPSFIHLPGKPALLNLTRTLECKTLLDPREILEAICKGVTCEKKDSPVVKSPEIKQAPSPLLLSRQINSTEKQTKKLKSGKPDTSKVVNKQSPEPIINKLSPEPINKLSPEPVDNLPQLEEQDPIEKLESYVVKYGEEASKHIGAGMKIFSHRLLLPLQNLSIQGSES